MSKKQSQNGVVLTIPQLRVLRLLGRKNGNGVAPHLSRANISVRLGLSPISGTVTRALHGIKKTSKGAKYSRPYPGLIGAKLVEEIDQDGLTEYCITPAGTAAKQQAKRLPKTRDRELCINKRYQD